MRRLIGFFDTMAGRIFVLLFVGLFIAGVAGVRISALQRAGALEDLQHSRAADRVAAFLSPGAALSGADGAALSGGEVPGVHVLDEQPARGAVNESLSDYLRGRFASATRIEAYDAPLTTCFPETPARADPAGDNPYWRLRPPSCWVARLEFSDASSLWLKIETPMTIVNTPSAFDPIYMGALFIGAALLAFFSARSAAAPLRRLARSARLLGDNFDGAAFEETGPAEVRATATALNKMQGRISEQVTERTHMLSAIAHDLQTPLTRMRLRLDLLHRDELYEKLLSDMDEMRQLVREGLDLAYDVMPEEQAVRLDLDSLIDSIVQDAIDVGAEIVFAVKSGSDVSARPGALRRCIVNLLNNAIRYGREIEVTVERCAPDRVSINILDRGPGIPADQLETILKPFQRLSGQNHANRGGTGLGLAIAHRFALINAATLTLSNRAGGGLRAELQMAAMQARRD